MRPIAIGYALRRLVCKCPCAIVRDEMQLLLSPSQLGFGVPHGIEAAVHAGRAYLTSMDDGNAKIGFLECIQHTEERQDARSCFR